ncbi:MAG: hypothetical protein AABW73_00305 [Nanoarchaeota archaeon]
MSIDERLRSLEGMRLESFVVNADGSSPKIPHKLEFDFSNKGYVMVNPKDTIFRDNEFELLMSGPDEVEISGAGLYKKTYDRGIINKGITASRRIVYRRIPDED